MYRRLPIWAAELAADFFPPGNCPWCDIWDDYFHDASSRNIPTAIHTLANRKKQFDPSIQHWILRVDHEFHAGIELGDMSFSEVPLEIMERIAVTLRAWSFSRRDALGVLSSEVFRLIEDIIGNDRMMALGPVPNHYGPRIYNQNAVGLHATLVATDPRGMRPRLGWRA
ncbi:hypothetical protein Vi05172_g2876 [Venturia inaequalis]|nr:hypothetical protein Vi05172_g2876 [Venturia inaequalis]